MTTAIRAAFQRLKNVGDALHADLGVTASMRAVLETLIEHGPQTVPQIARAKRVTRQHIQAIADALHDARLVDVADNPAHRRSPLFAASDNGKKLFAEMRRREERVLSAFAGDIRAGDLDATLRTLAAFNRLLETHSRELEHENRR